MSIGFMVFAAICLVAGLAIAIQSYNGLISLRSQLERAWANIDVLFKQRHEEIPQLIQVVEQFVGHESSVLQGLVDARSKYQSANSVSEKIAASQEMTIAVKGMMAIGEAYPELKSNNNFLQLQKRVSELEGMIADRRESYNEAVANFNTRIEQFPDVFAANFLNFTPQEMIRATDAEKVAPSLKMNLPKFGKGA